MTIRQITISLVVCSVLAALMVRSDSQLGFGDWVRFTLVANSAVILFFWLKNRKRLNG